MFDRRLLIIFFGGFTGPFGGNVVLTLIPVLKEAFNVEVTQIVLSITFFMIPFAIVQLFSGAISDIIDRRTTMISGLLVYALGSLNCGLSSSIEAFILSRIIQGVGYAFVAPSLLAILADLTTETNRGKAMGFYGASNGAGIASGPFIAGLLAEINWRYAFFLTVTMALSLVLLFYCFFREKRPKKLGIAFRSLATNTLDVFVNPAVLFLNLAGFLTYFSYIGAISFTSDALSLPPFQLQSHEIGTILGMAGMAGIIISPFAGSLVDGIGRLRTALVGYLILGFVNLLFWGSGSPYTFLGGMLILGTGTALAWASLLTLTVEIDPGKRGTVASVFNSARFFGYALSPLLLAPVYIHSGINTVYLLNILFSTAGFLLVYFFPQLTNQTKNKTP